MSTNHNLQKKAAVINDFTSFGRCSLTVTIPILSALRVQCCPVPTAIFTNHTDYPSYAWTDYTEHLDDYICQWSRLGLRFDAIATGFLGSIPQVDFVKRFLHAFHDERTQVVVDPVMGDHGRLYATYNQDLANAMRSLLDVADILTPNLTEACALAGWPYNSEMTDGELADLCGELSGHHNARIVISGISRGDDIINFVHEPGQATALLPQRRIGTERCGTGDVFSSVIVADAVNGIPFVESVRRASAFVAKAVTRTMELGLPEADGLAFEDVLEDLIL
jgi:pyridoxine kinase